ncbi:MAG TPA: ribonuclease H-like domain-containing protein [bacterium]|nr:ribonuclease H-like domain-containing protein [bacterium]
MFAPVERRIMKAFLDIETSFEGEITVLGIYRGDGTLIQLVGKEITKPNLLKSLVGTTAIYTYNGSRFDLPVIKEKLSVDLDDFFATYDLMYDCWERNLYGGLKKVEQILGIKRRLKEVDGWVAMELWYQYEKENNKKALQVLLEYNKEDIVNLPILMEKLGKRGGD